MPQLTDEEVDEILAQYPLPDDIPTVRFATDGVDENATAVFVSSFGVGQQQRANVRSHSVQHQDRAHLFTLIYRTCMQR